FSGTTWNAPPVAPPKPTQNAVSRGIPNVVPQYLGKPSAPKIHRPAESLEPDFLPRKPPEPSVLSDALFNEQDEPKSWQGTQAQSARAADMGGLWLAMTILLIVITAFGAGFLIVRPLLSK
ncbi:MAG: hypothetical protein F6K19_25150, partial [Cyanothece sp. SIO1E1]|nr:hypothetical protein [Cyanothece sp. SIO1E1]